MLQEFGLPWQAHIFICILYIRLLTDTSKYIHIYSHKWRIETQHGQIEEEKQSRGN